MNNEQLIILFGDFTLQECSIYQSSSSSSSLSLSSSSSSSSRQSSYNKYKSCERCGYYSHKVENCIAKRNIYGEFIDIQKKRYNYPLLPLNGWCVADKTNYNDFIFSEEEIQEWEEEDQNNLYLKAVNIIY